MPRPTTNTESGRHPAHPQDFVVGREGKGCAPTGMKSVHYRVAANGPRTRHRDFRPIRPVTLPLSYSAHGEERRRRLVIANDSQAGDATVPLAVKPNKSP